MMQAFMQSLTEKANTMCDKYLKTIDLMQLANEKIQYPRIHLHNGFVLQRAGANAKYPGSINITDGKPYGRNQWFGRISTTGVLTMPNYQQNHSELLQTELDLFQLDPAKYAECYGKATANCMFCHKELTAQQSVAVGYGPTCAANYGLPWGEYDKETAKQMSSLQLELPSGKEESSITRTNCTCGTYPPNMECNYGENCKHKPLTANKFSIDLLREVAIVQLSESTQGILDELIETNPDDEYMLLVTALWEAL